MKEIERWMSILTERQKEVAFWCYINHDYEYLKMEDGYPRYKGLPLEDRDIYSKKNNKFTHTPGVSSKLGITRQAILKHLKNITNKLSSYHTEISYPPLT
jgi:hypothetical protein